MDFQAEFLTEFDRLYDQHYRDHFQPALANLKQALTALLEAKFVASQRMRQHVDEGRIKSANRVLLKAQTHKYRPLLNTPADIFVAIRDIVGTRITCNTLSDVYAVVNAIKDCATNNSPSRTLLKLHDDWEDDYIKAPKESGYRGINLVVGVRVPIGDTTQPITCEIQVRTLLQHAWGELTHEDTYKPGVKVPDLVEILSKRLATTLAVLDEIAQDLRGELDKVERLAVAPESQATAASPTEKEMPSEEMVQTAPAPSLEGSPSEPSALPGIESLREVPAVEDGSRTRGEGWAMRTWRRWMPWGIRPTPRPIDSVRLGTPAEPLCTATESPETGVQLVKEALDQASEQTATETNFRAAYPEGRDALGTVVHIAWDYALVQLPEGDTGILHVSQMKTYENEYVDPEVLLSEGDTVRVRVLTADPESKRIELKLIRQERSG